MFVLALGVSLTTSVLWSIAFSIHHRQDRQMPFGFCPNHDYDLCDTTSDGLNKICPEWREGIGAEQGAKPVHLEGKIIDVPRTRNRWSTV